MPDQMMSWDFSLSLSHHCWNTICLPSNRYWGLSPRVKEGEDVLLFIRTSPVSVDTWVKVEGKVCSRTGQEAQMGRRGIALLFL